MRTLVSITRLLLLYGLSLVGCARVVSSSDVLGEPRSAPPANARHVYALFLNSPNDPLRVTRFSAVCDYARAHGFPNSRYYAAFTGGEPIARDIRQIRRTDPNARVCLIAWSGASTYAFDAAKILSSEKITVDSIIYLDSQWLIDRRLNNQAHPRNVGHALLLYREGHQPPGDVPNAEVHVIPTAEHLAVATNPVTVEYIVRELRRLASARRTPSPD